MSPFLSAVFIFTLIVHDNNAARILAVFPVPSISHQVVFRPLTQELAKRGHEVFVITPDPVFTKEKPPANLTEIDVHDVSYKIWIERFMSAAATKGDATDIVAQLELITSTFSIIVGEQVKNKKVQELINDKNQKFDLLLIEACVRPALVFSHVFKAPVILVSSLGAAPKNYEWIGAPDHPILYPSMIRRRIHNLSRWEKITETYLYYSLERLYERNAVLENDILKQNFGPDVPSVQELSYNIDMLFLNIHPIFDGIRPVPPSVVFMGGLHQKPSKELPKELKSYLDSSKHGVIYFSLGTNVDPTLLPPERIQVLLKVLTKLPYNVLMKWNAEELPGKTDNIRISKWLPQSDLLNHPKVKLFITQGGLQSTDEAITSAVPLIGFPMLADQWFNVEKYEYHKIGVKLDINTVTEDEFMKAIKTVIEDESYKRNIIKLRNLMQDQPQRPLERAVWWAEHVIRHGGAKHLRSPAANISWAKYLELELVLYLLAALLVLVLLIVFVIFSLYRCFCSGKVKRD